MKNKKIILLWFAVSIILTIFSFYNFNRFAYLQKYPQQGIYPFETINSPKEYSSFLSLFIPLIMVFLEIVLLGICYLLVLVFGFIKKFFERKGARFSPVKVSLWAFVLSIIVNLFFTFEGLISLF